MSLLELLKEHLKKWPEGVRCLSQDAEGQINENTLDRPAPVMTPLSFESGHVWSHTEWDFKDDPDADDFIWVIPPADDAATAIVTREMWEEA